MNPLSQFFSDLVVVEAASVLAGPYTSLLFAEHGARVIKIENAATGGDVTRQWKTAAEDPGSPVSAYYASVNFKKEVLFLDLKSEEGRRRAHQIIASADILISNFKKGDDEKLGLDIETLRQINPRLITGRISGFGPDDDRTAFDLVLQAETGFMSMNGTTESGPLKMPVALIDVLAAHQLREGLLCALLLREKTGKGSVVDVSLFDSAIASLVNQASNYLVTGKNPELMGSLHPNIAPYGESFVCRCGKRIVLACGNNAQFIKLCALAGLPALPSDPRFTENSSRVRNRAELGDLLGKFFLLEDAENILGKLLENGVPAGIIRSLNEVFGNPAAKAMIIEDSTGKRVETSAFRWNQFNT